MKQDRVLKKLRRSHWTGLEKLLKEAYQEGFQAGLARARGASRRARPIRDDATTDGLIRRIEADFRLDRFTFEIRVVHPKTGRRVPGSHLLRQYSATD